MEIQKIDYDFSVCRAADEFRLPPDAKFCFTGRTDEENSLVCPTELVPEHTLAREDGWKAFRIRGVLDFSLIGILARIASLLAENGISIFAVSTYNTDYVLVKKENYEKALELLSQAGWSVVPGDAPSTVPQPPSSSSAANGSF